MPQNEGKINELLKKQNELLKKQNRTAEEESEILKIETHLDIYEGSESSKPDKPEEVSQEEIDRIMSHLM